MYGALFLGSASTIPFVAQAVEICKMFGTGVIAATAWIHLLPDAFSQFSNPCLQGYWNFYGTNYVGLFGLISAFIVQLVEMGIGAHGDIGQSPDLPQTTSELNDHIVVSSRTDMELTLPDRSVLKDEDKLGKLAQRLQTIVLEGGILTHSIIIGITLGVTPDDGFTTLLIAICFHQVRPRSRTSRAPAACRPARAPALAGPPDIRVSAGFRGHGARGPPRRHRPAPQVPGPPRHPLPAHHPAGHRPGSRPPLLVQRQLAEAIVAQGILDSLSAGILMYNTYAELIGSRINHNPALHRHPLPFRASCFLAMYLGAAARAVVGIWA